MKQLQVGDAAPVFTAIVQKGNTISSTSLKGKKWVVYFYPKDNTPGCTAQACSLRDGFEDLRSKGIEVFGVSADSLSSHQKFSDKFDLPFSLLVDEDKEIIHAFGVWGPKKFMGKEYDGIHRTTFLIDENFTIISVLSKPNTKDHATEILQHF